MKNMFPYKLSLTLILSILLLSACQRDNLDDLIPDDADPDPSLVEFVDVTGQLEVIVSGSVAASFYAYLTSCPIDDFYLHTLVYADDFRFENNLVVPSLSRSQVYWTSFDSLQAGTYQAYTNSVTPDGEEQGDHIEIEITELSPVGTNETELRKFGGTFYPNPVYNPLTSSNTSYAFSGVSQIGCEFDDIEPGILNLPNGEMTEWATGRSQFIVDGETQEYSAVMQYCDTPETSDLPLEAYIHIGHGVTNYNEGPNTLAIGGEYLIYFEIEEMPNIGDPVEAKLFPINEEFFINFSNEYLQENGMYIALNVAISEDDRFSANFSYEGESSGSGDFTSIMGTVNTRIQPCN